MIAKRPDVQVLWQCGSLYVEQFKNCETAKLPNVKLNAFIDRMDLAYKMADVAIARAGALTVSNYAWLDCLRFWYLRQMWRKDHQTKNAMAWCKKCCDFIKDSDAQAQMIAKALELLDDEVLKQELSTNIKQLAKPNAAEEIANEVLKLIPNQRL
ncbi:MAG: hypothetical protein IPJ74_24815 [Saprospiraceae bacterium]|nr:hypothetical protein [Saprospiraceae bacterium]